MIDTRAEILTQFETTYRELRGTQRSIRAEDRLVEDLAIDSLLAQELLFTLEDRLGLELLGNPQLTSVQTVNDVVEAIIALRS